MIFSLVGILIGYIVFKSTGWDFLSSENNPFNFFNLNDESIESIAVSAFRKFSGKYGGNFPNKLLLADCPDGHYTPNNDPHIIAEKCTCPEDYSIIGPLFDDEGEKWLEDDEWSSNKNGYFACKYKLPTDWVEAKVEGTGDPVGADSSRTHYYYKKSDPESITFEIPEFASCAQFSSLGEPIRNSCGCRDYSKNMRVAPEINPISGNIVGYLCTDEPECSTKYTCHLRECAEKLRRDPLGYNCDGLIENRLLDEYFSGRDDPEITCNMPEPRIEAMLEVDVTKGSHTFVVSKLLASGSFDVDPTISGLTIGEIAEGYIVVFNPCRNNEEVHEVSGVDRASRTFNITADTGWTGLLNDHSLLEEVYFYDATTLPVDYTPGDYIG